MSRTVKNIIMSVLLILVIGLTVLTVYFKNNSTPNGMQGPPDGGSGMQATPDGNEMQTSPTPPDGNGGNGMQTPPTPPDGNNGSGTQTPPTPPDGNSGNGMQGPPDGNGGGMQGPPDGNPPGMPGQNMKAPIYFYFIFAGEGLAISIILLLMIMTQFNKISPKEALRNGDKKIIFGLCVLIVTYLITAGASFINTPINKENTNPGGPMDQTDINYNSAKDITEDKTTSENFSSTTADQNAVSVSGKVNVTIKDSKINKTGDSSGGDTTSFYGINSALIAKDGANLTLENINVETSATGANGVFCYGGSATTNNNSYDGTTITIKNSTIKTEKDASGGIMTTGGGIMNAENLTIKTAGKSSAAIRTDRGGGTVTVNKGTYETTGVGSPAIYSTADVTVKNATLKSTTSEGIIIEGKNKVSIENVNLTDNNNKLNGQSTTYKNIFIYQSMSGDAKEGTATFKSKNSNITTEKGDTFYITNTTADITLENNKIVNKDSTGNFLRAQKDSWGNSGSNGGIVTLSMKKQTAEGDITVDEVSSLTINMSSNSSITGTINTNNTAKEIKITLDKTSKIKLTKDSYVTELNDADKSYSNIDFNGFKLYVNGKAIN